MTVQTRAEPSLADIRTSFRYALRARNLAPRTVTLYLDALDALDAYLAARGMPRTLGAIRREHVEAFVADRLDGRSPATVLIEYHALQQFWKWALEEGEVSDSPMARMRKPKVPEQPVPVIDEATLRRLLRACEGQEFADRRDLAMVLLLVDTGMRRGELIGLTTDALDLDRRTVRIVGGTSKSRRERVAPIGSKTVRALDRYNRVRASHRDAARPNLWLGLAGPMTVDGLAQAIERRCRLAGIPRINPHAFRHRFAHDWLAQGGHEGDLMEVAGWRSRSMVDRYARSTRAERARANYRSPADRL